MSSPFASIITRPFQGKRSSKKRSSALYEGRMSFSSDTTTLLNVEPSVPMITKVNQIVVEAEALDLEDQAWGSPPPSDYKWLLPKFARRRVSRQQSLSS